MPDLHKAMLDAHDEENGQLLASLYEKAADEAENRGNIDAACFFLTHAYVFALEEGLASAEQLQMRLWRHGREVEPAN